MLNWLEGYFFWTAFVWMAYQLIGRNPDFRRARTWGRYWRVRRAHHGPRPGDVGLHLLGPVHPAISYRNISSGAVLHVDGHLAPGARGVSVRAADGPAVWLVLGGDPRPRPGARARGRRVDLGERPRRRRRATRTWSSEGLPIRIFIFTPFIALVLVMVGVTAIVALRSADDDAARLATRLHQEASASIRARLDDYLARSPSRCRRAAQDALASLLRSEAIGAEGRAFILDATGAMIASSARHGDPVVHECRGGAGAAPESVGPARKTRPSSGSITSPRSRCRGKPGWPMRRRIATTATGPSTGFSSRPCPKRSIWPALRAGNSRSAMVFALALVLSLMLAAALASMVTAPLRRMARATQTMARGDLSAQVPGSRLEELGALAQSFNDMSARLKTSFDDLVGEVETRKRRERELEESEARVRASEDRLQLAIEAAGLGIWDWDVEQDRLVWDDSMYRLYGVRKEEFTGALDAWSRCLVPEDLARATGDVQAALRGDREYRSDFRVRRGDGAVRTSAAWDRRSATGWPGRAHGRYQPGRHRHDQCGARTRAARPRAASTRSTSRRWWPAARPSCAPPRRPRRAPAARRARSSPTCLTRSGRR